MINTVLWQHVCQLVVCVLSGVHATQHTHHITVAHTTSRPPYVHPLLCGVCTFRIGDKTQNSFCSVYTPVHGCVRYH
jgi:hypothetical protein